MTDNQEEKAKVFIAIMALNNYVHVQLAGATIGWIMEHPRWECTSLLYVTNKKPVSSARNYAVKQFLATNSTHLCMVDHDQMPPTFGAIDMLVADDKDVVSGNCLMAKLHEGVMADIRPASWRVNVDTGHYESLWSEGLEPVDSCTSGFWLIKREVIEAVGLPAFHYQFTDEGIMYGSSEVSFCEKARDAGFEIWTDYRVPVDHYHEMALNPLWARVFVSQEVGKGRDPHEVVEELKAKGEQERSVLMSQVTEEV